MSIISNEIFFHENKIKEIKIKLESISDIKEKLNLNELIKAEQEFILSLYKNELENKNNRSKSSPPIKKENTKNKIVKKNLKKIIIIIKIKKENLKKN